MTEASIPDDLRHMIDYYQNGALQIQRGLASVAKLTAYTLLYFLGG